jgi:hypothetical protein
MQPKLQPSISWDWTYLKLKGKQNEGETWWESVLSQQLGTIGEGKEKVEKARQSLPKTLATLLFGFTAWQ